MKKPLLYLILFTGISFIYSCKKDGPLNNNNSVNNNQSMSGSINGKDAWAADSIYSFSNSGLIVIICKNKSDGSQIMIQIPSNISLGSHIITSQNSPYQVYFSVYGLNSYLSYGNLTINSDSNNTITGSISGSFSLVNGNTSLLNLTIEAFRINYQPIATRLSAVINDTNWNASNFKTYTRVNAAFGDSGLFINGSRSNSTNNDSIILTVPLAIQTGTYELSNPHSSQYLVSYFKPSSNTDYFITTGKMTVTMNTGTFISGNFQGTLTPDVPNGAAVQLANGNFFIRYR